MNTYILYSAYKTNVIDTNTIIWCMVPLKLLLGIICQMNTVIKKKVIIGNKTYKR